MVFLENIIKSNYSNEFNLQIKVTQVINLNETLLNNSTEAVLFDGAII